MNAITAIEPAAPVFPLVYGMILSLNGATVDGYEEGDIALMSTLEVPHAGDLVCVHTKRSGAVMLVLDMDLGLDVFERMPWVKNPGDELEPLIVGTIFAGTRRLTLKASSVWAVHKCDGRQKPDEAGIKS
jgi:hypothetical protein